MFIARAGRPGLLGMAVRTAVVAGTAQATAGAVARRQQERADQRHLAQAAAAQPVAPPPPSVPSGADDAAGENLIEQLQKLATLHSAGALTDEEFAAAKANILG